MTRVWFVTGSSRGLGRALVELALEAGDRVAATTRNPERLRDLLDKYGDAVLLLRLDVTDYDAAARVVAQAEETFGRIDVVVNNAGYSDLGSFEDTTARPRRGRRTPAPPAGAPPRSLARGCGPAAGCPSPPASRRTSAPQAAAAAARRPRAARPRLGRAVVAEPRMTTDPGLAKLRPCRSVRWWPPQPRGPAGAWRWRT
jgi:short chain dehydrogenase